MLWRGFGVLRKEQGWGGHGRAPGLSTQPSQLQEQVLGISSRLGISLDGNIWMGDLCSLPSSGLGGLSQHWALGETRAGPRQRQLQLKLQELGLYPKIELVFVPFVPAEEGWHSPHHSQLPSALSSSLGRVETHQP